MNEIILKESGFWKIDGDINSILSATSRGIVRVIFNRISDENTVLNFEDVGSINRSSAHELLEQVSNNNKIFLSNLSEDLILILKAVEATMAKKSINRALLQH